jgi:hypothetical protein
VRTPGTRADPETGRVARLRDVLWCDHVVFLTGILHDARAASDGYCQGPNGQRGRQEATTERRGVRTRYAHIADSPPARSWGRDFRLPSVLLGEVDVNGLAMRRQCHPPSVCTLVRKKLAMPGFFFYNDKYVLLFEQVPKREGGEARISQVERL